MTEYTFAHHGWGRFKGGSILVNGKGRDYLGGNAKVQTPLSTFTVTKVRALSIHSFCLSTFLSLFYELDKGFKSGLWNMAVHLSSEKKIVQSLNLSRVMTRGRAIALLQF
jgi:hypothetical protein